MGAWGRTGWAHSLFGNFRSGVRRAPLLPQVFSPSPRLPGRFSMCRSLAGGWSMTDVEFSKIITKPDNVPITILIFTVGLLYLAGPSIRQFINDERIAKGEEPLEAAESGQSAGVARTWSTPN